MFHGLQIGNHHVQGVMEYVHCVSMIGYAINISYKHEVKQCYGNRVRNVGYSASFFVKH